MVAEAKRGIEAQNPQYQLYGERLAAAKMNWTMDGQDTLIIFGCYTVADVWTFVRGQVVGIESDKPSLYLASSQEYSSKSEAEAVVEILQKVVVGRLESLP